jgi:hypothetical protein
MVQQRKHTQNTHETLTRARDHHLKTLTDSQRSHIIGQRSHCSQNTCKKRWGEKRRGARPRSNNARTQNTHETLTRARDHHLKTLTDSQRSRIIGQRSHCSNFLSGPSPGRRRRTPQICAASPNHGGIISLTQLRSLARTHATQSQPKPKSISRLGGGLTSDSLPPTSDFAPI